uniref:Integrase, catalytic region, zinc finger, CCHC-type, peptidase aspartic, catalytic n=1 Tax=Tanacetum cinerariifolium TaxID=118510 RepID=A0A6L2P558_TANCI|nr:integrase, catalytic region, zinc finger, CCHC-type, peptidase aspartic, catalytic [Tanacetum cinerariifolium]
MESMISLGQKNILAEYTILFGADNRPPMLDKDLMELYMQNKEHERMILELVKHGLLIWPTIKENESCQGSMERIQLLMQGDDPITCLNKAMAFLTVVASSRFPLTNNQLRTSSNPRNQATIQDGRVTLQQVQERQGQSYFGTEYKSHATSSWGNNSNGQAKTEDLDTYDSDCDDLSNAQAVLMANISNYGFDVISEVPHFETYLNDMENQRKANKEQNNESLTAELERYKERVKIFEQRLNIDLSSHEKMIDSQMDDMIKEKLALKEQVDSLEQNLSKQIKEKECLLQTFTIFKSGSKEKEDKYMENEIDLEKKIKELDNILFKVGQSAQTVHMLTKPQAIYDNIHKQALGLKCSTSNSESKATRNKKNDRISQIPSWNIKNKVEAQTRNVNKKNRVIEPIRNVDDKQSQLNANSELICAIWNCSQLMNYVNKFLGTVRFGNDHIARIMGYGDYQLGNVTISRVYYVERLGHNLFSVGQFCDADLEVAFQKNTCFIRNLDGVDLISRSHDTNLYIISLDDMLKTYSICLLSKASKN